MTVISIVVGALWTVQKDVKMDSNSWKSKSEWPLQTRPTFLISQNTEESSRDLRRLADTQTRVEAQQLMIE